jgi:hypothetical protein
MPRFVDDSQRKTIQAPWWGEKETCTIKKFAYGDRQWLAGQTVAMGMKPGASEEDAVADFQIDRMNLAILERGIVAWTDEEGEPIRVTRQAIEQLTEQDADFILSAINDLNPRRQRTEDEQESFRGRSGDGATKE